MYVKHLVQPTEEANWADLILHMEGVYGREWMLANMSFRQTKGQQTGIITTPSVEAAMAVINVINGKPVPGHMPIRLIAEFAIERNKQQKQQQQAASSGYGEAPRLFGRFAGLRTCNALPACMVCAYLY